MNVLVVGVDAVDAGKTTFSVGLVARTGAAAFKPRAGNDYWFDHDHCRSVLASGRIYGHDAMRLSDARPDSIRPEAFNPVHRLWRPSPDSSSGLLGRQDRTFLLDRVGDPSEEAQYVINDHATLPDRVQEALPLEGAKRVTTTAELNEVMESLHLPALSSVADRIQAQPVTVIESYGDVASPLRAMPSPGETVVAAVEPRRVRLYPGSRYLQVREVLGTDPVHGQLETPVHEVLDEVSPTRTVSLPPLTATQRSDPQRIASAYESAYTAVLKAAHRDGPVPETH